MSIKVLDGPLFQWDSGRWVILTGVDADCQQVHFAHVHHSKKAIVTAVITTSIGKMAPIPNSMLTSPEDLVAWAYDAEESTDGHTISGVRIPIAPRPRPDDYIYVPTEVYGYEAIVEMVEAAIGDITTKVDYELLRNKPRIEGVELVGDRQLVEFGVHVATVEDVDGIFKEA